MVERVSQLVALQEDHLREAKRVMKQSRQALDRVTAMPAERNRTFQAKH
jgi:hypothetical protein